MNPAVVEARRVSTRKIFSEIARTRDITRVELAQKFHVSAATVTLAVNELLERSLVVETKGTDTAVGRKAMLLRLNEKRYDILVLDLSVKNAPEFAHGTPPRDNVRLTLCDLAGHVFADQVLSLDLMVRGGGASHVVELLTDTVKKFLQENGEPPERLLAIPVISPGIVFHDGTVDASFYHWKRLPITGALESAIGVPAFADTILRIDGQYELQFVPSENRSVVYLTMERGVGLSFFKDGKALQGKNNTFGEIGHISLDPNGPPCYCGNRGCFERYCENSALLLRFEKLIGPGGCPILTELAAAAGGTLTYDTVFQAYRRGSILVQDILTETAQYLGCALTTIRNILDPDCIILSGRLVSTDSYVLQTALRVMREQTSGIGSVEEPEIRLARLKPGESEASACFYAIQKMLKILI